MFTFTFCDYLIGLLLRFFITTLTINAWQSPACLAYLINIVEPAGTCSTRSGLRSTSSTDYTLPQLCTKFAERAFSYAGPSAWNGLPQDLRAVADPAEFGKELKSHFFTAAHNV